LNKIRQEIVELQSAAEAKKGEVQQQDDKVAAAQKALDEVMGRVENRKKAFDRNGMEASIVAVNNDWGFVVVNAGEKEGITPKELIANVWKEQDDHVDECTVSQPLNDSLPFGDQGGFQSRRANEGEPAACHYIWGQQYGALRVKGC
jgi:hypothetical protein